MMTERLIVLINQTAKSDRTRYKEFEEATGIAKSTLRAICDKRQKLNEDHISAIIDRFPQYAYWLTTGKTIVNEGQISPELENIASEYGETGTDTN